MKKKRNIRRIVWIGIALILVAMIVAAFLPKPVVVETTVVEQGGLQVFVEADGRARVHDRFVVSAPVAGKLRRIDLRQGDVVEEGMAVATIVPPPLDPVARRQLEERIDAAEAIYRQANAAASRLQATVEQARREASRLTQLNEAGAISTQDREQAENAVRIAERELAAARFSAQAAQHDVELAKSGRAALGDGSSAQVVLRSPTAGRVLQVVEESERLVAPGTPLVVVGDPSGLEVVVDLLSSDAVAVHAGMPVEITGWGGKEVLRGRVKYVEPAAYTKLSALGIEEQRVNVVVEMLDNAPRLGDGYAVDARVITWQGNDVVKVPTSALFRHEGVWSIFIVSGGVARRTPVKVGERNAFEAQILEGVKKGDRIILHPSDQVSDGIDVESASEGEE